tara:strand:- start:1794 stop:2795 length:1002 start_codon:yes stop_codon:yes gene_type:complete
MAAPSKLMITDLDISIEDASGDTKTDKNLEDGETIRHEISPESKIEFKIELKNNYTSSEGLEIEDITVDVFIRGIDDDDDLEESSSDFNLRANKDKTVTFDFSVPLKVEEDVYSIDLEVEGDDENGTTHTLSWELYIELEKENHLLKLDKAVFEESSLQCSGSTYLDLSIVNIGTSDEDVELYIQNNDLNINERMEFSLSEDPFDSDSSFKERVLIDVPDDIGSGGYPLRLRIQYDDETIERNLLLKIVCSKESEVQQTEVKEQAEVKDTPKAEVAGFGVDTFSTTAVMEPVIVKSDSLIERYKYIAFVVLAYAIVLAALITFGVKILKRKNS